VLVYTKAYTFLFNQPSCLELIQLSVRPGHWAEALGIAAVRIIECVLFIERRDSCAACCDNVNCVLIVQLKKEKERLQAMTEHLTTKQQQMVCIIIIIITICINALCSV